MRKYLSILVIFFSANAVSGDGHYLLENCREAQYMWNGGGQGDESKAMYCVGMLNGLVASMTIAANSTDSKTAKLIGMCRDDQSGKFVTTNEAIDSVVNFLSAHPKRLDEPDFALAMKALQSKYLCK